jgi:hypothetical protein
MTSNTVFRKIESSIGHNNNTRLMDSVTHSALATNDRKDSGKERPASVMNKKSKFDFTRKSSNESISRHDKPNRCE